MITPTRLDTAFDGAATHAASDLTGQLASLRALEARVVFRSVRWHVQMLSRSELKGVLAMMVAGTLLLPDGSMRL